MNNLPKIPSEYIEPYLKAFLMCQIEGVALGLHTPEEVRNNLNGVEYFVSNYGGLHSTFATSNMYGNLIKLSDEKMIEICKATYKTK